MNPKIWIIIGIIVSVIISSIFYFSHPSSTIIQNQPKPEFNQTAMLERGDVAMGFNQGLIHHHFMATATGGEIMIMSTNMSDIKTINDIRTHVRDIQQEFSQGNFTKPFYIHAQVVNGTDIMTKKKAMIQYSVKDIDGGSILILTTNDTELHDAIQQFMNFQSSQHMGH